MKIILLGYMGSGKSTIGQLLSAKLQIEYLDLDSHMESAEEMTISEIFRKRGEIYFRSNEGKYLKEVLGMDKEFILSTGGGTPCYGRNMEAMLQATKNVIHLKVSINELVRRLSPKKEERPLIARIPDESLPEFIGKHLFERNFFYQKAWHTVECDGKSTEEIVSEIHSLIKR